MPPESTFAYTTPERLIRDFVSRGLIVLAPEDLGIPADVHDTIYAKERAALGAKRYITAEVIPEILEVTNAPGVVAACDRLVGPNWAIVPFTHNTPFMSGARDQHWHKDDNGPFNLRRHRHHHAVQIEMLYYPQAVAEDMGPTATVPFSQYWTFNHEENHDNFAGADHLDFGYQVNGMERSPASGPDCAYDEADVIAGRTPHDVRMREAVAKTGWPLVAPLEVAPLKAGSVVLYSHNLFHRANHRRDDWRQWKARPRFMWRFWLYRTTDPDPDAPEPGEVDWRGLGIDPVTKLDYASAPDDAVALWRHHYDWMHTGRHSRRTNGADLHKLEAALQASGESCEPARLGAAYKLAASADREAALDVLGRALRHDRESVRRAGLYGLIAAGADATPTLLDAADSPVRWVRRGALCALGDAAPLTSQVLAVVARRLAEDDSVYVRSVAAGAFGCLGRRAIATGTGRTLVPRCLEAIVASLDRERNRLGMNIAQDRSIKFVRPTDECDVCEGIGINYGVERFEPVRSAVRENALWSAVILCSHGVGILGPALKPAVEAFVTVVKTDKNLFSVGLALDALARLANARDIDSVQSPSAAAIGNTLDELLRDMPIRSWEAFARGGVQPTTTWRANAPKC